MCWRLSSCTATSSEPTAVLQTAGLYYSRSSILTEWDHTLYTHKIRELWEWKDPRYLISCQLLSETATLTTLTHSRQILMPSSAKFLISQLWVSLEPQNQTVCCIRSKWWHPLFDAIHTCMTEINSLFYCLFWYGWQQRWKASNCYFVMLELFL